MLEFDNFDFIKRKIPLITPSELSNEEYHSLEGISPSGIKQAWKDPKLYAKRGELRRIPSPALTMGTALHEAMLEPQKFNIENYDFTKTQREKLEIMIHNGKIMFEYLLKNTKNEHSLIVKDAGFIRRIRMDAYDEDNGIVYDIKSTQHNSPQKFMNDFYEFGYHLQSSFYMDTLKIGGYRANNFGFLCIPSESPCEPFAVKITERFVEDGREIYTDVVQRVLDYQSSGSKEVYFRTVDLPRWRLKQLGEIDGY